MASDSFKIFEHIPELPPEGLPLDGMLLAACSQGKISATLDKSNRIMKAPSVLVLRPGHYLDSVKVSDDFKGFFITLGEKKANELIPTMKFLHMAVKFENSPMIQVPPEALKSLTSLYAQLQEKLHNEEEGKPYSRESLRCLCELMFYDTISLYASNIKLPGKGFRRQELLDRFIELVELNFKKERKVDFYARRMFVTSKHLSSVVKLTSGHTAGELIAMRVMSQARLMLRNSGLNIQEIADELHFKTQSFFGKYFKAHTGVSPREFRNSIETYS